jgi:hypothetical protein
VTHTVNGGLTSGILDTVATLDGAPVQFWNVVLAKNCVEKQLLLLAGPRWRTLIIRRRVNARFITADGSQWKRALVHFHIKSPF